MQSVACPPRVSLSGHSRTTGGGGVGHAHGTCGNVRGGGAARVVWRSLVSRCAAVAGPRHLTHSHRQWRGIGGGAAAVVAAVSATGAAAGCKTRRRRRSGPRHKTRRAVAIRGAGRVGGGGAPANAWRTREHVPAGGTLRPLPHDGREAFAWRMVCRSEATPLHDGWR